MPDRSPQHDHPVTIRPEWASVRSPADLGRFLARRRRDLTLTQEEVAARIGVNRRYVHEIENGKDILAYRRLFALLRALGLDLQVTTPDDAATPLRRAHAADDQLGPTLHEAFGEIDPDEY